MNSCLSSPCCRAPFCSSPLMLPFSPLSRIPSLPCHASVVALRLVFFHSLSSIYLSIYLPACLCDTEAIDCCAQQALDTVLLLDAPTLDNCKPPDQQFHTNCQQGLTCTECMRGRRLLLFRSSCVALYASVAATGGQGPHLWYGLSSKSEISPCMQTTWHARNVSCCCPSNALLPSDAVVLTMGLLLCRPFNDCL